MGSIVQRESIVMHALAAKVIELLRRAQFRRVGDLKVQRPRGVISEAAAARL